MTDELDQTLEALADPTRRAVVDLLSEGPLRSGALAQALSLSPPAMSRHLRVLRRAGLVEEHAQEDDARVRVYRLRPEPLQGLRSWVDEVSAFWGDQLEAFRLHAERTVTQARDVEPSEHPPTHAAKPDPRSRPKPEAARPAAKRSRRSR